MAEGENTDARNLCDYEAGGVFARFCVGKSDSARCSFDMSNIAEGFERKGRGELHQFLSVAKAACAEVRSQVYVALDAGRIEETGFKVLLQQSEEVGRILGGLRASVERQKLEDQATLNKPPRR